MALVRILVDGYSLLHGWPQLAPGKARHSEAARDELIRILTLYQDLSGTPITIFFDGAGKVRNSPGEISTKRVEILFSSAAQTADQMIERVAHRMAEYGEVMVVTDDYAERDTVVNLGGTSSSCDNFVRMIENALAEMAEDIKHHNRREQNRFKRRQ